VSRGRFGLLLGLIALAVGALAFVVGVAVLDDDGPDDPPQAVDTGGTRSTSSTTQAAAPAEAPAPTWIAVVASSTDRAEADEASATAGQAGFDGGVLRSDDHESLNPGLWVAYVGPYPDPGAADRAVAQLAEAGIDAYPRCVGTDAQCS